MCFRKQEIWYVPGSGQFLGQYYIFQDQVTSAGANIFFSGWHGKLFAGAAQGRYFQVFFMSAKTTSGSRPPVSKVFRRQANSFPYSDSKLMQPLPQYTEH